MVRRYSADSIKNKTIICIKICKRFNQEEHQKQELREMSVKIKIPKTESAACPTGQGFKNKNQNIRRDRDSDPVR